MKAKLEKLLHQFENSVSDALEAANSDTKNDAPLNTRFTDAAKNLFYDTFSAYRYDDDENGAGSYADDLYKLMLYFRQRLQNDDQLYINSRDIHKALASLNNDEAVNYEVGDAMADIISNIAARGALSRFKCDPNMQRLIIDTYCNAVESLSMINLMEYNKRELAKSTMRVLLTPSDSAAFKMQTAMLQYSLN